MLTGIGMATAARAPRRSSSRAPGPDRLRRPARTASSGSVRKLADEPAASGPAHRARRTAISRRRADGTSLPNMPATFAQATRRTSAIDDRQQTDERRDEAAVAPDPRRRQQPQSARGRGGRRGQWVPIDRACPIAFSSAAAVRHRTPGFTRPPMTSHPPLRFREDRFAGNSRRPRMCQREPRIARENPGALESFGRHADRR